MRCDEALNLPHELRHVQLILHGQFRLFLEFARFEFIKLLSNWVVNFSGKDMQFCKCNSATQKSLKQSTPNVYKLKRCLAGTINRLTGLCLLSKRIPTEVIWICVPLMHPASDKLQSTLPSKGVLPITPCLYCGMVQEKVKGLCDPLKLSVVPCGFPSLTALPHLDW